MEKLFSPEEVAEYLNVKPEAVRIWLRTAKLRGSKLGNVWRIPESSITELLKSQENIPPQKSATENIETGHIRAFETPFPVTEENGYIPETDSGFNDLNANDTFNNINNDIDILCVDVKDIHVEEEDNNNNNNTNESDKGEPVEEYMEPLNTYTPPIEDEVIPEPENAKTESVFAENIEHEDFPGEEKDFVESESLEIAVTAEYEVAAEEKKESEELVTETGLNEEAKVNENKDNMEDEDREIETTTTTFFHNEETIEEAITVRAAEEAVEEAVEEAPREEYATDKSPEDDDKYIDEDDSNVYFDDGERKLAEHSLTDGEEPEIEGAESEKTEEPEKTEEEVTEEPKQPLGEKDKLRAVFDQFDPFN